MPKTRLQKEQRVQELTDKLEKATSVVFTNYQGMTMSDLSGLRGKLSEISAEYTITKNNLLKIALKNAKLDAKELQSLDGQIATVFSFGDPVTPIKVIAKGLKDAQKGSIKAGLLDKEILDAMQVQKLADLPSKDELRAKVVGTLGAPLYGIVGVLQANLRNLVYALDQIRMQKGGEVS